MAVQRRIESILVRRSISEEFLPGGYIHILLSQQTKVIVSSVIVSARRDVAVSSITTCYFRDYNAVKCWENLEVNLLHVAVLALLVTCFSSISF